MRLVVITGLSGAGKSQALKIFEDFGYYCIDNLPPALLPEFVALLENSNRPCERVAVGIDIRSALFEDLISALHALTKEGKPHEMLFLDCSDEVLIGRFKEARRAHPLGDGEGVQAAVTTERAAMQSLRETATHIIDTTSLSLRALREAIGTVYQADEAQTDMAITVMSFGFKQGLPRDADWVFDARFLPNPYHLPELRPLSGLMPPVQTYVFSFPAAQEFLTHTTELLRFVIPYAVREGRRHLVIAVGCTGGRHRSVALAQRLAEDLREEGSVTLLHRDIDRYEAAEAAKASGAP